MLLEHARQLRTRVDDQRRRLAVLESLRAALTPVDILTRPGLDLAAVGTVWKRLPVRHAVRFVPQRQLRLPAA